MQSECKLKELPKSLTWVKILGVPAVVCACAKKGEMLVRAKQRDSIAVQRVTMDCRLRVGIANIILKAILILPNNTR